MGEATINVKLCGITREHDIRFALDLGIHWIGINVYPPSPRCVEFEAAEPLLAHIPPGKRVCVDVMPTVEKLQMCQHAGFDYFQVHIDADIDVSRVQAWTDLVGADRLWLAPKLAPGSAFPEQFLPYSDTFLLDAFSKHVYGGTGHTSDWGLFAKLRTTYKDKKWILAGGLNPDNLAAALAQTGAENIDVNSGVESAPGIKDAGKLHALFA